ncbi:urease accessory protein UreD [Comamonas endophytica]|uniref:Urease accessory protein UreD n=1 Tax=Comamonas endophytica TaxID=2949090 RepID=A0ABY6G773_9BURK|nr:MULTISPECIES: urease accessory protein UreD [unclassified Acidovorax]MCD2511490.1 urease accessory protein UreD [Acidovorax sp. D4N7]UYG50879.1 urease accessory protein UreD [Acidovorax sp. 5MLIR]
MAWLARLEMDYAVSHGRSVVHHRHDGPLRVLRSLYPEGGAVCHNVLVHPPGGLVGGDTLDIRAHVAAGAHALVTTPGATRFYRAEGASAVQQTQLTLETGARMEWLPLETIAYSGCEAHNRLELQLAPGAELIGWDVTALGLPHAGLPFVAGSYSQHMALPGVWLEQGRIAAGDTWLMDGPLGLDGQRCLASLFFVTGSPMARERRDAALELTRALLEAHPLGARCGVTSPQEQVLVLRAIAPLVEPVMQLWQQVWHLWRAHFWGLPAVAPRIWSM